MGQGGASPRLERREPAIFPQWQGEPGCCSRFGACGRKSGRGGDLARPARSSNDRNRARKSARDFPNSGAFRGLDGYGDRIQGGSRKASRRPQGSRSGPAKPKVSPPVRLCRSLGRSVAARPKGRGFSLSAGRLQQSEQQLRRRRRNRVLARLRSRNRRRPRRQSRT